MEKVEKSLDELDSDYSAKKVSYDNLPTFKREMVDRYDQVIIINDSLTTVMIHLIFWSNCGASELLFFKAFLGILQNEGRIEPFIDSVMSFLHRKTDFYRTLTEESQVGFPVGVPENMLRCYFSKYNQKTKNDERKAARNKIKVEADPTCIQPAPEVKPEVQIKEPVQQSVKPKATIPKDQDEWQNNPDSHNGAVRFKLL